MPYVCGGSRVAAARGRSAPSDSRFGITCVTQTLQSSCAGEIAASMIRGKEMKLCAPSALRYAQGPSVLIFPNRFPFLSVAAAPVASALAGPAASATGIHHRTQLLPSRCP